LIFDSNIHLPKQVSNQLGQLSLNEKSVLPFEIQENFEFYSNRLLPHIAGGNIMIFNEDFILSPSAHEVLANFGKDYPTFSFTQLVDPRRSNVEEVIYKIWQAGGKGIKFHSYVQKLENSDIRQAVKAAVSAAEKGLMICIDTSFGNALMYSCDNMKLACEIAQKVEDVPIILLHSGGLRMYEAMLLADACPNVYLETSFSIHYYADSPKWEDFVFVYRKLGAKRLIFGSDFPYISIPEAVELAQKALHQAQFSAKEVEQVFYSNAQELFYD